MCPARNTQVQRPFLFWACLDIDLNSSLPWIVCLLLQFHRSFFQWNVGCAADKKIYPNAVVTFRIYIVSQRSHESCNICGTTRRAKPFAAAITTSRVKGIALKKMIAAE